MARVLVTGGAGFIGSHICDLLLERGYSVTVLDNESTGRRDVVPAAVYYLKGDVRNPADIAAAFDPVPDAVIHIAGQASIRKSFMNPLDDLEVNTVGTVNILQACIQHRVPRLLFASSMTIYGTPEVAPTPESAAPAPIAYYGVTKYAAERYVHLTAARQDLDFDFHVTSFRMFNVYGRRQSLTNPYQGVFAIFMGNVLRNEPIHIHSDGEQSRDFVHVSDVARAWVEAIPNENSYGEVINLGTGRPTSVNRLCDLVLESFGHTRQSYPVHYHPSQPGDIRVSAADVSKAHDLLNWEPAMTFEDGMRDTIQWAK
ncbi:MAG: NAD-dependent epimerase/dehydratase family protein, partial [Phototrophicaceae bacterium]